MNSLECRFRFSTLALFLLFVLTCWLPIHAAAEQSKIFRTGFLQSTFKNIDIRDAKAVLEMNSREIARLMNLGGSYEVIFYPDAASMVTAVRNGGLDLVALPSIEFMRIRKMSILIPAFVNDESNGRGIKYVLIARKESGIQTFSDLKGKSLLMLSLSGYEPSHLWLEVLLMKEGKVGRDRFFSHVRESAKQSSAIMDVFFGKADAAIVPIKGFEVSQQLNPQLGKELSVLMESPHLINEVVCMTSTSSESFRNNLFETMIRFGASKPGKQLYSLFQTSGIIPFKEFYMEELESLSNEQKRLKAKTALKK